MAAAWASGLRSLVNGTGANIKIGEMFIVRFLILCGYVPYHRIVYQIVKYYVYVICIISLDETLDRQFLAFGSMARRPEVTSTSYDRRLIVKHGHVRKVESRLRRNQRE